MTPIEISQLAEKIVAMLRETPESSELDVNDVATLLKISVPTVERLTASGELPSYTVGRLRRYSKDAVLSKVRAKEDKGDSYR